MSNELEQLSAQVDQNTIKGFLNSDEAVCLYYYAADAANLGPCLEVGSYCGKSTIYFAKACQLNQGTLYAVDHHRGSEEHQLGEEYHDAELYDDVNGVFDSFPVFRKNISIFALDDTVVPIVASSAVAARDWQTPLAMVFIDGGHSEDSAMHDCFAWGKKLIPGGVLAMRDIYLSEVEGGQAPRRALEALFATGDFVLERKVGSLVILRVRSKVCG